MKGLLVPALLAMTVATAVGAAYSKHESRKLFQELQRLETERDAMNIEWGQLQLEQSTKTTHGEVELKARERLGMDIPGSDRVVILHR